MIKSSKVSLKWANSGKLAQLRTILDEYRTVMDQVIALFWGVDQVPKFISNETQKQIKTKLSARLVQCAAKQALGIIRGTKAKQKKREFIYSKLLAAGKYTQAKKLKIKIAQAKVGKPNLSTVEMELDSRFVSTDFSSPTNFDGFLTLSSLYNKEENTGKKYIAFPFKLHRHINKFDSATRTSGVRLSNKDITFLFNSKDAEVVTSGNTLGIDIGVKNLISCSDGSSSTTDIHGHDLDSILSKLARKKTGSKAFKRACTHRTNYVNYTIKRLNLTGIKQVNIENIKYLRYKTNTSKKLKHFVYPQIFKAIINACMEHGVQVLQKNATYTSQRCSCCGWVRKGNRRGKLFECNKCKLRLDADLNAAINISLPLVAITTKQRQLGINRTGFYWLLEGQEPIVPVTNELVIR